MLQWGIRQSAEFESQMTSVERVLEYTELPIESETENSQSKQALSNWPTAGHILFKGVTYRYPNSLKPVLHNLNFEIKSGEKIGIVGRTGAGKSSLISALFRMVEPEGEILIDNISTKSIKLSELRRKISIIPQDPVLFSGTIRRNLDPFHEYPDSELWQVVKDVQLKDVVDDLPGNLDARINEGGSNFSVGQRQLVCLGRAALRMNKILVIDEATANVDHETDKLIQETIRKKFKSCTVLTIAHRLNTIIDSDRILVLDAGQMVEFDEPYNLLLQSSGLFCKLVKQTGQEMAKKLSEEAQKAYIKRHLDSIHYV